MFWVYILRNSAGRFYTGSTGDLEKRIYEHNWQRKAKWTGRQSSEWQLVYREEYPDKHSARVRENEIKRRKSRAYIEKLVASGTSSSPA
jgi:putative endonuclease